MNNNRNNEKPGKTSLNRKDFLKKSAMAATGFFIVPRYVLGGKDYKAPSDRLNIASIGVGGVGSMNTRILSEMGENIYALCDVDEEYAAEVLYHYTKAKRYVDFRKMLDKEKEIDAVVVATPDHSHAAIAIYAMQLGKHAFVQKPLARTIYEARRMAEVASETGVVTQMGNQGHLYDGTYDIVEWIRQGAIGKVTDVDCWTDRPNNWWPQGADVRRPDVIPETPYTMHWDLWIGPSPYRPYHPDYAPFRWRGRWDFGTGALGDMGAHLMDQPYWALELGSPQFIQASSTPYNREAFPLASMVTYNFPGKNKKPPVRLRWYDGGLMPARPDALEPGKPMGSSGGGMIFHGSKGKLMADLYGRNPRFIPESAAEQIGPPERTMERATEIHEEWVTACKEKSKRPTSSNFEYAAALTETLLLGNLAIRFSDKNQRLEWDSDNMKVKNLPEANEWLDRRNNFRPGWREIIG